jgi:GxxExxY protein
MVKYRDDLIYKEISYQIVGVMFNVYNELGYGYQEKYYQKAIERALDELGINYRKQVPFKIVFKGKEIGLYYLDFLIYDKVVVELKVGKKFAKRDFDQVTGYLHATNRKLALLVNFTPLGVKFLRVINFNDEISETTVELKLNNLRKLLN